jgi:hypothetical protein
MQFHFHKKGKKKHSYVIKNFIRHKPAAKGLTLSIFQYLNFLQLYLGIGDRVVKIN